MIAYHNAIIKLAQATVFYSTWHPFDNKMRLGSREEYLCIMISKKEVFSESRDSKKFGDYTHDIKPQAL